MASNSFVVNNDQAQPITFTLQSQSEKETKYIVTSSTLTAPVYCIISHQNLPLGRKGMDKHLVRFGVVSLDTEGNPHIIEDSTMLKVDRAASNQDAVLKDLRAYTQNFMSVANTVLLADGVTP